MRKFWTVALFFLGASVLSGCVSVPEGITPVSGFELNRYLGKWYEIARLDHSFERGLTQVTAEYSVINAEAVRVKNRGLKPDGQWDDAIGEARFVGDPTVGSLKVSFFGPFYGGYHIFILDENYQYAVVCGPNRDFLWILSRTPTLENALYDDLVSQAQDLGFATDKLIKVPQIAGPQ